MGGEQASVGGLMLALLGPVRIGLAGQELAPVAQQLLRVLASMLGLATGRAVSVPVLIDGLWGEDATPEREKNLHSRISALRRLLEEAEPGRGSSRVVRSGDGYLLRLDPGCLDVQEFTALAERARGMARAGDTAGAAGLFREALALWRGPALQDAAPWCPWLAGEATRLEQARAAVAEERVECDLALGRHGDTVSEIASLAEAFPLRERLTGQLMVALWRCGRRGDALAAYDRTRRVLATELGLDPGPELRRLHAQLLADDPSLTAPQAVTGMVSVTDLAPGHMPAPLASFVGRQAELAELDKLVGRHRLVTITGPGGAGKTRLAIEVAAPLADDYRDGAWFADLAEATGADGVPGAIAAALGMQLAPGEPVSRQVLDRLAGMQAILVADNCEHLVDAAAEVTELILENCPGVRVIATSRQPLAVPGEIVWETPPIAFPRPGQHYTPGELASFDAVKLFTERIPGLRDGVTGTELQAVAGITATLDGLPLAIELAAARAARLGLEQLAGMLKDRVGLSLLRSRTRRRRQQTLDAAIGWSYDLLTSRLRSALRKLSVFAGGFTLEAAAAVTGADDIVTTVDALAERSLIAVDRDHGEGLAQSAAPPRYRMLETIRQYCAARIAAEDGSDGDAVLRDSHSRYFADLAGRAYGPLTGREQGQWLTALEADYANLIAALNHLLSQPGRAADALRMTVCLERFWHNRGHLGECAEFLRRGLDAAQDVSSELRCAALNLAGQAELNYDTEPSRVYFTKALDIARRIGDDRSTATALWGLSYVHHYAGDARKHAACASEALETVRSSGDLVLLGECLLAYGEYLKIDSRPSLTRAAYAELLEVTSRSGDRIYAALAHNNFGDWALIGGDLETARDHLEQAQAIYAEIGKSEPVLASNLGWVRFGYGDLTAAGATFARAVQMAELHRVRWHGSLAILGLGCVAAARQDWERAAKLFGFADAEQASCGAVWLPPEKTYRERWAREAERALGPQRFASLHGSVQSTDRGSLVDFALGRSTSPLGSRENPGVSPLMLPASYLRSPVGDQSPRAHCPSRRQAQHPGKHPQQLLRDRRRLLARQPILTGPSSATIRPPADACSPLRARW
jgi:predicted ATPase/DNA-binding SARP family transcriptional activator